MPLPFDIISTLRKNRKDNRRKSQQGLVELSAVLGNELNVLYVPGWNGNKVYVRLLGDSENENATYQPSTTAFVRGNFFEYAGSPVLLKHNNDGALVLVGPDETQVAQAGNWLSLATLNNGSKQNKFVNLDNVLRLKSVPVSRGYKDSTLVSVAQFIYDHYGSYVAFNGTPLQADKVDLASFVPSTGEHILVQLWLDTFNNTVQNTASTAKDINIEFVQADYDAAWLGSTRFQDWIPLQAYQINNSKGDVTTITQKELQRDHRQFVNMPDALGNENNLTINTRIRANRQFVVHDNITIPAGYTLVIEAGAELFIDNHPPKFTVADFDPNLSTPDHLEGRLFYDSDEKVFAAYIDEPDVTLQIGLEQWLRAKNDSGSGTTDGKIFKINGASGNDPTVEFAQANAASSADSLIGVGTHDISTGVIGIITTFGKVRGIDTSSCAPDDKLWLSATTPGGFTNVQPEYPNYPIMIGTCLTSHASDGIIFVNIIGQVEDILQNGFNGGILETVNFTVTSDGATITGNLERAGGGDLTMNFSSGFFLLDTTPAATIVLTAGTATAPQQNYIYIPESTKVLTVSTSDWPTGQHIKIADVAVLNAATTETDGALGNRNWNDHVAGLDGQGHIQHIAERLRQEHAQYKSGVGITVTIDGTPSPDNVTVATTAGVVYQLHRQNFPLFDMAQYAIDAVSTGSKTFTISDDGDLSATFPVGKIMSVHDSTGNDGSYTINTINFSSPDFVITVDEIIPSAVADGTIGDDIHVVNNLATPYTTVLDLSSQTLDSAGASLSNKHFSFVIWGVQNRSGTISHLFCNLPSGSYSSSSNAINDLSNYSNFTIPSWAKGLGFLIARLTFNLSASGGGTWTLNDTEDLRGKIPNATVGAGGGGAGVTDWSQLSDTPNSYSGQAGLVPTVNVGETALEFTAAGGAGNLEFVEEKTFVSAATTTTFSGLTGTDTYYLEMRMVDDSGLVVQYEGRINGDANSNDYAYQQMAGIASSATAARLANVAYMGFNQPNDQSFSSFYLSLVDGRFIAVGNNVAWDGTDALFVFLRGVTKNTAGVGSISAIEIIADQTNGIGVDSILRLYKVTT